MDGGTVRWGIIGCGNVTEPYAGSARLLPGADGSRESFEFDPLPHVAQPLIQTVVDERLGRGVCPSTGESAARTSRVMDELVRPFREREASRRQA